jgi:hypothetical protein
MPCGIFAFEGAHCTELLSFAGAEFVLLVCENQIFRIGLPALDVSQLELPEYVCDHRSVELCSDPAISPSGRYIAFVDRLTENRLFRMPLDPNSLRWLGTGDSFRDETGYWSDSVVDDDGTVWCNRFIYLDSFRGPHHHGTYFWKPGAGCPTELVPSLETKDLDPRRSSTHGGWKIFNDWNRFSETTRFFVANPEKRTLEHVAEAACRRGNEPICNIECFFDTRLDELSIFQSPRQYRVSTFRVRLGRGDRNVLSIHAKSDRHIFENGTWHPVHYYAECELFAARSSLRNLCVALLISRVDLSSFLDLTLFARLEAHDLPFVSLFNDSLCQELAVGFINWQRKMLFWQRHRPV